MARSETAGLQQVDATFQGLDSFGDAIPGRCPGLKLRGATDAGLASLPSGSPTESVLWPARWQAKGRPFARPGGQGFPCRASALGCPILGKIVGYDKPLKGRSSGSIQDFLT